MRERGRPIAADTKLARVIKKRKKTYGEVAREITRSGSKIAEVTLSGIVRGKPTSLETAKAIVAWVGNPRELRLSDLVDLS